MQQLSAFWIRGRWSLALAVTPLLAAIIASCGGGGPTSSQSGLPTIPSTADFQALLPTAQLQATIVGTDTCGRCHGPAQPQRVLAASAPPKSQAALADIITSYRDTVHYARGVGCESCHGPGSSHVTTNGDKSVVLTFPNVVSSVVCSQCHAQTHSDWSTSKHDDIVDAAISSGLRPGTPCLRCHSAWYRTEVVELGRTAGDQNRFNQTVDSASCIVCHNPHRRTGNLTDEGREAQLRQAIFSTDRTTVGAGSSVAAYTTFNHVCAKCHNGRGTNPSDSALNARTTSPSMHDSNQYNMLGAFGGVEDGSPQSTDEHFMVAGQCSTCHMFDGSGSHSFVTKVENCAPCHTPTDAAARKTATIGDTQSRLIALRTRMEGWARANLGDEDFWDYSRLVEEQGKTPPNQTNVPIQVKRARHNYYFVLRDASFGVHNGRYVRYLIDVANRQLNQVNAPQPQRTLLSRAQMTAALLEDRRRASRADVQGH